VAVVVTTGSGIGLETALGSLTVQDYDELSILVLANGQAPDADLAARVAAIAPAAFVRVLDENRGFGAACNEASLMVEGATFYLFCHDDVRFTPSAVRQMVEGAFRANAGIVTPKYVYYDDPRRLLHVGQLVDRFGSVHERIEHGEEDHGQQDLERDVFVAPSGATLVRADLFATLRGFDPIIAGYGEDLDLCWRAQVAGARVVVVPSAVVAHRESGARGERPLEALGARRMSRDSLVRRHRLVTFLTCWTTWSLIISTVLLLALEAVEVAVAAVGRDRTRVRSITGSWSFAWRHRRVIRRRRQELADIRVLDDGDVRRLQVGGSHRAQVFIENLLHEGYDRARGVLPHAMELTISSEPRRAFTSDGVGFAANFSEDVNFEEFGAMDDLTRSARIGRTLTSFRAQMTLVALAMLVWIFAIRNLVAGRLPLIGRLTPLDSWWSNWHYFFASWSPAGVGSGAPGMPGFGVLAFAGTFVFGRMGVLPRVALVLAVPAGAVGVARLLRGVASNRARVIAAVAYLALPTGMNFIARGRIDLLVLSAGLPYVARRLLGLWDIPGFRDRPYHEAVTIGQRAWGATRQGQVAKATFLVALMTALAPVTLILVTVLWLGVWVSRRVGALHGGLDKPGRTTWHIWIGTAVLLLPMTADTLLAGRRALSVFGLPLSSSAALSVASLIRGVDGPFGSGWTSWLLPVVALVGVVLARSERRHLATLWSLSFALVLVLETLVSRHWSGSFAPDIDGLLVMNALMIAVLVGGTISVFETDLSHYKFGWPQFTAAFASLALVAACAPFIGTAGTGRFDLPLTGAPDALTSQATPGMLGGYRIVWLGDPRALPAAGWSVAPGLAAAVSTNGSPSGNTLFVPPASGATDTVLHAVSLAARGATVHLGRLLASAGVADLVVMSSPAPVVGDGVSVGTTPPPPGLLDVLNAQRDLVRVTTTQGVAVYRNTLFHGIVSSRATAIPSHATWSSLDVARGWSPVLSFDKRAGVVPAGSVVAALAPADAWSLIVNGHSTPRRIVLGWAGEYRTAGGRATLVLHQFPLNGILALVTLGLWLVSLVSFGGSERLAALASRRRPQSPRHLRKGDA
jgi:GT2 family glycosyltransferase